MSTNDRPGRLAQWDDDSFVRIHDIQAEIARQAFALAEERLITRIEEIEGRVPTGDEIKAHGRCYVTPGFFHAWLWRGQCIVTLERVDNHFTRSYRVRG